jgi:hypothetical protein
MGGRPLELAGKRFGRWYVLAYAGPSERGLTLWRCRCECGHVAIVLADTLRFGVKRACNRCAMLAKRSYRTIARLRAAGVKQTEIALRLKVSRQYVGSVVDFLENRARIPRSKTHRRRGHRFTKANTGVDKHGKRRCRACQYAAYRKRYLAMREAQIRAGLWPKSPKPPATHCRRGHPYTPENLILAMVDGRQRRQCKICAYAGIRARRAKQRALG